METSPESSKPWLDRAWMDLYSAQCLATHHPAPYEVICSLCQQATEKALKGFLAHHRVEPPRTHDGLVLCSLCEKIEPRFQQYEEDCGKLNPYAVMARYPNQLELEKVDADRALSYSDRIFQFVSGQIEMGQVEEQPHGQTMI